MPYSGQNLNKHMYKPKCTAYYRYMWIAVDISASTIALQNNSSCRPAHMIVQLECTLYSVVQRIGRNLRSSIEFAKRNYKVYVQVEEAKINGRG